MNLDGFTSACRSRMRRIAELPYVENALEEIVSECESAAIHVALDHCAWNLTNTAKMLGINRITLRTRMRDYGISRTT